MHSSNKAGNEVVIDHYWRVSTCGFHRLHSQGVPTKEIFSQFLLLIFGIAVAVVVAVLQASFVIVFVVRIVF